MIQNIQAKLFPTLLNIKEVFAVLVLGAVVVAIVTGIMNAIVCCCSCCCCCCC